MFFGCYVGFLCGCGVVFGVLVVDQFVGQCQVGDGVVGLFVVNQCWYVEVGGFGEVYVMWDDGVVEGVVEMFL